MHPHSTIRPPWPADGELPYGSVPGLEMTLGRLLERSERTGEDVSEIKERLRVGDSRMQRHEARLDRIEAQRSPAEPVGALERWIKDLLRWALPLGAAWATGGLDTALKVLRAYAGG